MRPITLLKTLVLLFPIVLFTACENGDESALKTEFGIFEVIDENTIVMDGEISSSTLNDFLDLIDRDPSIRRINIMEVPGSTDDGK
jgi:hypothetical protein